MANARMLGQFKPPVQKGMWEVKRDGQRKAYGSIDTFLTAQERKELEDGVHKLFVDGRIFKEG